MKGSMTRLKSSGPVARLGARSLPTWAARHGVKDRQCGEEVGRRVIQWTRTKRGLSSSVSGIQGVFKDNVPP